MGQIDVVVVVVASLRTGRPGSLARFDPPSRDLCLRARLLFSSPERPDSLAEDGPPSFEACACVSVCRSLGCW